MLEVFPRAGWKEVKYPSSCITVLLSLDWLSALFFLDHLHLSQDSPQPQVHSVLYFVIFLKNVIFTTNCISLLCLLNPFALPALLNFLVRLERPWVCHTNDCGDEKGSETKTNI